MSGSSATAAAGKRGLGASAGDGVRITILSAVSKDPQRMAAVVKEFADQSSKFGFCANVVVGVTDDGQLVAVEWQDTDALFKFLQCGHLQGKIMVMPSSGYVRASNVSGLRPLAGFITYRPDSSAKEPVVDKSGERQSLVQVAKPTHTKTGYEQLQKDLSAAKPGLQHVFGVILSAPEQAPSGKQVKFVMFVDGLLEQGIDVLVFAPHMMSIVMEFEVPMPAYLQGVFKVLKEGNPPCMVVRPPYPPVVVDTDDIRYRWLRSNAAKSFPESFDANGPIKSSMANVQLVVDADGGGSWSTEDLQVPVNISSGSHEVAAVITAASVFNNVFGGVLGGDNAEQAVLEAVLADEEKKGLLYCVAVWGNVVFGGEVEGRRVVAEFTIKG